MIRFFANHPTAANLLMLMFIILGMMTVFSLRLETFPDFSMDKVQITAAYPGATAEDIEEALCQRIEDAVDGLSYVAEVVSEARENQGIVTVEMEEGGNFRTFIEDIKTEVEAINDFPDKVEKPVIKELNRTDMVVSVAVSGPMSASDLKVYCEDLKDRLRTDKGISLVDISGFSQRQIRIAIPALTLMQYGISMDDIANTVSSQSVDLPLGTLETDEREVMIRFTDQRKTVDEFRDLVVVAGETGAEIKLGDIAQISDMFELDEDKYLFDGERAGLLKISKTKSEDTVDIFDRVKAFVQNEQQIAPPGVKLTLTQDMSSMVRDRLRMLLTNAWQGLILVFVTLWIFFNIRLSFWVAMGLPISFLGAFFFFPQINYSLNMLTMVGLLIGLGLLMDDAIVIAENVVTHISKGKSAINAVIDGVSEVKNGVISSFATTVFVFGPVSLLEGTMGKVLRVMPVVLILVLFVSLAEAFWILPRHLAHSLRHYDPSKKNRFRLKFEAIIAGIREKFLGKIVDFAIRWRYLIVGLAISVFIVSVGMLAGGILKFKPFPETDGDTVQARILLPQGTPLEKTEKIVTRITEAAKKVNAEFTPLQPGNEALIRSISVQYNVNADASESGPHVATVSADLLKSEKRNARIDDVLNRWREMTGSVPDIVNLKFTEPSLGPAGKAIDIRLKGTDLDRLKRASSEMQAWLSQFRGVFDLSDDLRPGKPEIRIRMKEGAMASGLTARMISEQLRSAYYGKTSDEIQVRGESYEIDVRLPDADKQSLADLEYFHVTMPDGKQTPLGSVAVMSAGRGYARIASVDGMRTVTVQGDVDSEIINTAELTRKLRAEFLPELKKRYPDIRIGLEGEAKESQKTGSSMAKNFAVGLAGIFILLSFQFRSYIEPVVVMMAIPLSFIGVIWGHILLGLDICMPSLMGAISLAGIVVNDSILLVEFIKIRRREGQRIAQAAGHASRERFRAILLTSLTTIAGLLPLLAEKSLQAQILIPLAASIVFGLMASTALVLIIVPSLYTILGDFGLAEKI